MKYSTDLRRKTWRSLESHVCGRRLEQMFMKQERYSEGVELFDAKAALSTSAWSFVKRMIFSTNSLMVRRRRILAEALALFPFSDQVRFFTTLINQSKYRPDSFPEERSFHFIEFTLEAARLDASIRTALVRSGCVAYYNDTLGHDVSDRHAPQGVESGKHELWELIREVFGEEELQQSLDEDKHLFDISSTSFDVQLLDNPSGEYLFQVVVSDPDESQRWTIHKRLSDLLAVSRCNRQGRDALTSAIDETSESSRPLESKLWKEYHLLPSDKKEDFVEHFLRALVGQSRGPYGRDITAFFTSNFVDEQVDQFPVRRKVSVSPASGESGEEVALESAPRHDGRSFLYMKDEDARLDRFLDVGTQWGLL
ncbi:hypothetical protein PQX77_001927 [Marasmius sp. AFHP31]|nr:hypothetical protein PQX77_001927 [Marasmius sp. AFHP31]